MNNPRDTLPLVFIDSNVLFRMFVVSPTKIREHEETGSCSNNSLDYAIDLLLKLGKGGYSTSEIALLETVSVASRLAGPAKAETLLRSVVAQEGFRILETRALAYVSMFSPSVGKIIGLNIKEGERRVFRGLGGGIEAYCHTSTPKSLSELTGQASTSTILLSASPKSTTTPSPTTTLATCPAQ